jgi:hypothetical protein
VRLCENVAAFDRASAGELCTAMIDVSEPRQHGPPIDSKNWLEKAFEICSFRVYNPTPPSPTKI